MKLGPWSRALGLAAALLAAGAVARAETRVLGLGTGDIAGSYFPAGVALCRVSNVDRPRHGLRCAALLSEGSVANIAALRAGEAEFALVQSDVQEAALRGAGPFAAEGPFDGLRAAVALFPEPLALVVRADAGIAALPDLAGRRVGIGAPGSGQRPVVEALFAALGWTGATLSAEELSPTDAAAALCAGRLDAFFLLAGQPAAAVAEATEGCGARIVPVQGPEVAAFVAARPHLAAAEIPAGLYDGIDAPVPTFAVAATMVVRADLPAAEVETVVGAILDAAPDLGGLDQTLAGLDPAAMRQGLSAPLHPGAEAAFRARGLLD